MPAPIDERVLAAARNNAAWCDAVCRAHGGVTRMTARLWWNEHESPPFYPRVVTLDPAATADDLRVLAEHDATGAEGAEGAEGAAAAKGAEGADCAVKDGFAALDLAAQGFDPLFEARWIWRDPGPKSGASLALRWRVVATPDELAAWEAAWWRGAGVDPRTRTASPPLFPPVLLDAPGVSFLAACDAAGEVVAGGALADAAGAIGIACAFFHGIDPVRGMHDLAAAVQQLHPARPLTGYASGAELAAAVASGFTILGPLRVWIRRAGTEANPDGRTA